MSKAGTAKSHSGPKPPFMPLDNVCEWLNALHIYTREASQGITRYVPANHYCASVRTGLRQCLIYDSHEKDARLIGVEYMIPKPVYETLPKQEQLLWHSHEHEVKSGMLVLGKPADMSQEEWEPTETAAMQAVIGLYGKTWHFWQVDRGDELPLGFPTLMGSLTHSNQLELAEALRERNQVHHVDHEDKARKRKHLVCPGPHPNADSWWTGTGQTREELAPRKRSLLVHPIITFVMGISLAYLGARWTR